MKQRKRVWRSATENTKLWEERRQKEQDMLAVRNAMKNGELEKLLADRPGLVELAINMSVDLD